MGNLSTGNPKIGIQIDNSILTTACKMDKYPGSDDDLTEEFPPEFLKELEKKLNEPDELSLDPGITKAAIEGIEGYAFKEMLKKLHKKYFNEDGSEKE